MEETQAQQDKIETDQMEQDEVVSELTTLGKEAFSAYWRWATALVKFWTAPRPRD